MILKAWLDSWLSKTKIFPFEKIDLDLKNLLIWMNGFSLLFLDLHWAKNIKCIKGKFREIVALGIINCPLIVSYRLTKHVQIWQNNPSEYNNKCLLKVTLLTLVLSLLTEQFCYVRTHPNVKVHVNYRLIRVIGIFSIRFNSRLLTFTKSAEFLEVVRLR